MAEQMTLTLGEDDHCTTRYLPRVHIIPNTCKKLRELSLSSTQTINHKLNNHKTVATQTHHQDQIAQL